MSLWATRSVLRLRPDIIRILLTSVLYNAPRTRTSPTRDEGQSLDEQVEQHEKYKALVDKAEHLMQEHTRLEAEINKLTSSSK